MSTGLRPGVIYEWRKGMGRRNNLIGQRFGILTVIEDAGNDPRGNSMWLCKCDCGNTKVIRGSKLKEGQYLSCGCQWHAYNEKRNEGIRKSKITHGLSGTRLYYIYENMMKRCYDQNAEKYPNYGGRGITVCEEWRTDRQAFFDWALSNGYTEELTIDRIDVNGNYCPENCRWATQKEQANNRTSNRYLEYNGETHTVIEWAELIGMSPGTLYARIENGWTTEKALTTPV